MPILKITMCMERRGIAVFSMILDLGCSWNTFFKACGQE
jgi:hypothetical protein